MYIAHNDDDDDDDTHFRPDNINNIQRDKMQILNSDGNERNADKRFEDITERPWRMKKKKQEKKQLEKLLHKNTHAHFFLNVCIIMTLSVLYIRVRFI